MKTEPTTDDLYDLMCRGSRIPLDEVRRRPGGKVFEELKDLRVAPADQDDGARLDIGNHDVLAQLSGGSGARQTIQPDQAIPSHSSSREPRHQHVRANGSRPDGKPSLQPGFPPS